jgi:hypothetical protein
MARAKKQDEEHKMQAMSVINQVFLEEQMKE